jgi:hypothetical protein
MPTPINQAIQNATETNLTNTTGSWNLKNSTDEPAINGAVRWHFNDPGAPVGGATCTVKSPAGQVVIPEIRSCTSVYCVGALTVISGTTD